MEYIEEQGSEIINNCLSNIATITGICSMLVCIYLLSHICAFLYECTSESVYPITSIACIGII